MSAFSAIRYLVQEVHEMRSEMQQLKNEVRHIGRKMNHAVGMNSDEDANRLGYLIPCDNAREIEDLENKLENNRAVSKSTLKTE